MCDFMKKRSGVYRLRAGIEIEDFKFDVQLQQINSLLYFSMDAKAATTPSLELVRASDARNSVSFLSDGGVLTTRLKWQQKLLSPSESTLYSDVKNCTTETQRRYNNRLTLATVQEGRGKKRAKMRRSRLQADQLIFTYVQADDFVPKDVVVDIDVGDGGVWGALQPNGIKRTLPDEPPYEHMYVFAALKPDTELLRLTWDPVERQLYVYPDFCQSHKQLYYLEIDSNCRHLYTFNCMSVTHVRRRNQRRRRRQRPRPRRQRSQKKGDTTPVTLEEQTIAQAHVMWDYCREGPLPLAFSKPPMRCTRVTLLFELLTGQHFHYDNIHVRYHIELPKHTVHEEGLLAASTQSSSGRQVAHFAHNWQVTVLCDELHNRHDQLHVYFEVIAIDGWSCERDEGYAHYSCRLLEPMTPATGRSRDAMTLQCVRPKGNLLDALRRHFLGGRPSFDYVKYFRAPPLPLSAAANAKACCGTPMLCTGQLLFRVTKMHQNYFKPISSLTSLRPRGMSFDDVMRAYYDAQIRLAKIVYGIDMTECKIEDDNNNYDFEDDDKCKQQSKKSPKQQKTKQQRKKRKARSR